MKDVISAAIVLALIGGVIWMFVAGRRLHERFESHAPALAAGGLAPRDDASVETWAQRVAEDKGLGDRMLIDLATRSHREAVTLRGKIDSGKVDPDASGLSALYSVADARHRVATRALEIRGVQLPGDAGFRRR